MTGPSSELTEGERITLAVLFGGCPFDENVNDASMCRCGLPALGHDQAVAATLTRDNPEMFAAVERILADRIAALTEDNAALHERVNFQAGEIIRYNGALTKAHTALREAEAKGAREAGEQFSVLADGWEKASNGYRARGESTYGNGIRAAYASAAHDLRAAIARAGGES